MGLKILSVKMFFRPDSRQQYYRCDRYTRASQKRRCRSELVPNQPKKQRCGEDRDAKCEIIKTVGSAAFLLGDHVRDEGLFDTLGEAKIRPVNDKQSPRLPGRTDKRKTRIHGRVDDPARDDQSLSSQFIGMVDADKRDENLADVKSTP